MLSSHVKFVQTDRQTDGRTDRRTTVKQYAPPPRSFDTGHKNVATIVIPPLQLHCSRIITNSKLFHLGQPAQCTQPDLYIYIFFFDRVQFVLKKKILMNKTTFLLTLASSLIQYTVLIMTQ